MYTLYTALNTVSFRWIEKSTANPPHHSPNAPSEGTAGSIGIIHA